MLVCSRKMGIYEVLVATLDTCIQEARDMFIREQGRLATAPKSGRIEFAHGERVKKQLCISCKAAQIKEYLIVGKWVGGAIEGEGQVTWQCPNEGKFSVKGPKRMVMARLNAFSRRPSAAVAHTPT